MAIKDRIAELENALRIHVDWVENLFTGREHMINDEAHRQAIKTLSAKSTPDAPEETPSG